ncbi:MAG: extensin family protein [Pseudorhodobacter sp.]
MLIGLTFLLALDLPALAESDPRPRPRPAALAPADTAAADRLAVEAMPADAAPAAVSGDGLQVEPATAAPPVPAASSPLRSVRPPRRQADHVPAVAPAGPAAAAVTTSMSAATKMPTSIRPPPRPDAKIARAVQRAAARAADVQPTALPQPVAAAAGMAVVQPEARPKPRGNILSAIFGGGAARKAAEPPRTVRGSVCGDPAIRGESVPRITGQVRGCGIEEPVRVTEVDGVRLTSAATMDCDTAKALRNWVSKGLKPAFGRIEVKSLRVAAHYTCRTRNNRPGAPISEHGRGKAIDISGIILANGQEISILRDYRSGLGAPVRQAHKAACGPFGTTLGPGSDRFHNDHLHFDTARHRNGPYCR